MTSRMTMIFDDSRTKKTTKLVLFSILRRNLSKFVTQTGLYCSKQLETTFSSILWKPLHITFNSINQSSKHSAGNQWRACLHSGASVLSLQTSHFVIVSSQTSIFSYSSFCMQLKHC